MIFKMDFSVVVSLLVVLCCFAEGSFIGKFVPRKEIGGSKLSILSKPGSVIFRGDQEPINANEITSILSLALGFSVPKEVEWKGLLSGNPFNRPKAVLMFTVDSVPTGEKLKLSSTNQFPVKVDAGSSRSDLLELSPKKSLCDHVSEIFNEKSNTISLSASEDLAASGYSGSKRSKTIFWSDKHDAWMIIDAGHTKGKILYSKTELLSEMSNIFNTKAIKYHKKKNAITISVKTADISFDLDKEADRLFFGELALIRLMYQRLALKSDIIKDNAPDVFMFGISGLKGLQMKYGISSPQVKAAIHALEKFIPEITEKFVKLYSGNMLAVALTLKKNELSASHDTQSKKKIFDHVKPHLGDQSFVQFQEKFPELHMFDDMEKKAKKSLCEQMAALVSGFGLEMKFKCATEEEHNRLRRRSLLAVKTQTVDVISLNLASFYDEDFPVIFNMWFWLTVVLAISIYVISLVMWNMDPGRDSIIYRMTNQRLKID